MEAVGAFTPTGSRVRLKLGLPGAGDYEAVDVSVEPDGGSASHSGLSLAGGHFEPTVVIRNDVLEAHQGDELGERGRGVAEPHRQPSRPAAS